MPLELICRRCAARLALEAEEWRAKWQEMKERRENKRAERGASR